MFSLAKQPALVSPATLLKSSSKQLAQCSSKRALMLSPALVSLLQALPPTVVGLEEMLRPGLLLSVCGAKHRFSPRLCRRRSCPLASVWPEIPGKQ